MWTLWSETALSWCSPLPRLPPEKKKPREKDWQPQTEEIAGLAIWVCHKSTLCTSMLMHYTLYSTREQTWGTCSTKTMSTSIWNEYQYKYKKIVEVNWQVHSSFHKRQLLLTKVEAIFCIFFSRFFVHTWIIRMKYFCKMQSMYEDAVGEMYDGISHVVYLSCFFQIFPLFVLFTIKQLPL